MMKFLGLALLACVPSVAVAAGAPTVMSPYEVRANSVAFQNWIKVGSPNFIVYTDAKPSEASRVLREFEMLRAAGQILFGRKAARFGPVVFILPTESSDWRKLEIKGGMQEWKAAVSLVGGNVTSVVVAQYDWQERGLSLLRAIYADIERAQMDIAAPFWFERGLSFYFDTAEFDGDRVKLGRIDARAYQLTQDAWVPWGRFFEVNPSSPEFTKESQVGRFEGQAALFTQFLLSNPDRRWSRKLIAWRDYLEAGGSPTESQFASVFGQDWKQWQFTLKSYLDSGRYNVFPIALAADVTHFPETHFDLPAREVRELFVLIQTLLQRVPDSAVSLDALLRNGLRSDCLRELLLESCNSWGRQDAALKVVRQLIASGSKNSRVYRMGDALLTRDAGPFGLDSRMGPELPEVRGWDRRGIELEPLDVDLNESWAVNEACAPVVDQQSITTIEDCYRRIRNRRSTDQVIAALAMALWRIGDTQTAGDIAAKLADDPLVNKRYRALAQDLLGRIRAHASPHAS